MRWYRLAAVGLSMALLAAACGSDAQTAGQTTQTSDGSTSTTAASSPTTAAADRANPCTWVTNAEVEAALRVHLRNGGEPTSDLSDCTFPYISSTGISTDLVIGEWQRVLGPPGADIPGHQRAAVAGLGDRAVFLKAETINDGNSILTVTTGDTTFAIAGEFVTLDAARQLARIVLGRR
jgi:hypothetical protein